MGLTERTRAHPRT